MQGLTLKKNRNGFIVARLHYSADPTKATPEWFAKTRQGYSEASWRKEYEIDFEVLSGKLVYPDYNPHVHHISKNQLNPIRMQKEGGLYRILDHGLVSPTAVLWVWVDNEDNWIVYREYYQAGKTVPTHADNIKKLSRGERYSANLADPSIFYRSQQDREGNAFSIANRYSEYGLDFTPANNDFKAGSNVITSRLLIDPEKINPFTGEKGSPSIFFVKEELNYFNWEIQKWRYQEFSSIKMEITKNPKEVPVDKDNHLMDCLTYFANAKKEHVYFAEENKTEVQKDIHKILTSKKDQEMVLEDAFNQNIL